MMKKMPPRQKVLEAFTAIADGRVQMNGNTAEIASSDGSKTYHVRFDENVYASDDPATFWQGYAGYPVIAVLMKQGKLPYDSDAADLLKGVPWKKLNDAHKRDYEAAMQEAMQGLGETEKEHVMDALTCAYEVLETLDITLKRYRKGTA